MRLSNSDAVASVNNVLKRCFTVSTTTCFHCLHIFRIMVIVHTSHRLWLLNKTVFHQWFHRLLLKTYFFQVSLAFTFWKCLHVAVSAHTCILLQWDSTSTQHGCMKTTARHALALPTRYLPRAALVGWHDSDLLAPFEQEKRKIFSRWWSVFTVLKESEVFRCAVDRLFRTERGIRGSRLQQEALEELVRGNRRLY